MVFAYMGPADKQPPFPEFDYNGLPASNIYVSKFQLECNWLQATEGDFDPSHGVFLHSTLDNNGSNPGFTRFANRATQTLSGRGQRNFLEGPVDPAEPYPFAVGNRRFKKDDIRNQAQAINTLRRQGLTNVEIGAELMLAPTVDQSYERVKYVIKIVARHLNATEAAPLSPSSRS